MSGSGHCWSETKLCDAVVVVQKVNERGEAGGRKRGDGKKGEDGKGPQ